MKIFLDSSFFFPFIKIGVKDVSQEDLLRLINNNSFEISRSELTMFEISAKGWKYVRDEIITQDDLIDGINTISDLENIHPISFCHSPVQILAGFFRLEHQDFMDCLILASAIINSDNFITCDRDLIQKIKTKWDSEIKENNPNFRVFSWNDFIQRFC